jgi:hypothetical protein
MNELFARSSGVQLSHALGKVHDFRG